MFAICFIRLASGNMVAASASSMVAVDWKQGGDSLAGGGACW